jgi:acetate kinase
METTLILNAGSSTLKFRCYEGANVTLNGMIERIGSDATLCVDGEKERPIAARSHKKAGLVVLSLLDARPDMVVHRIVHGGARARPARLTPRVIAALKRLVSLAPLHLPAELALVELFAERTGALQVACFDTMFHRSMPAVARAYAIPRALARKHGIERYGFHGIAHQSLARSAARSLGRPLRGLRIVTCQLGNGASVCAVRGGKSVETSMGFSPLEGLVMGTRSGSLDPSIVAFLCERERMTPARVLDMLERKSGLLALGGHSDVRDLLRRERGGDASARLALDVFAHRARMHIGACIAALGGADAIALGGGISRAPAMRARILKGMDGLGIALDARRLKARAPARIGKGSVKIFVFDVDEQQEMFALTRGMAKAPR